MVEGGDRLDLPSKARQVGENVSARAGLFEDGEVAGVHIFVCLDVGNAMDAISVCQNPLPICCLWVPSLSNNVQERYTVIM